MKAEKWHQKPLYGSGKKAVATNPKTLTGGTFRTHSFPQK